MCCLVVKEESVEKKKLNFALDKAPGWSHFKLGQITTAEVIASVNSAAVVCTIV